MTQAPPSSTSQHSTTPAHGQSLADRLSAGEEFAVTFGGQGTDWFATLRDLVEEDQRTDRIGALVEESARLVSARQPADRRCPPPPLRAAPLARGRHRPRER